MKYRKKVAEYVFNNVNIEEKPTLEEESNLIDYMLGEDFEWKSIKEEIIEEQKYEKEDPSIVNDPNYVVNTIDTIRHRNIIKLFMENDLSVILCGPPGCGKTMIINNAHKNLSGIVDPKMIFINFSSMTKPRLVTDALEQNCKMSKGNKETILKPDKKVIVFLDEINLPEPDKYGTTIIIE